MELNDARITFLINRDGAEIVLRDADSNINFARVKLTTDQLAAALSRLGDVECKCSVYQLDKLGKRHENKDFEFEIPDFGYGRRDNTDKVHQLAIDALAKEGMSDWTPDKYYGSQNSFFTKDNKRFARAIIRRWVDFQPAKSI